MSEKERSIWDYLTVEVAVKFHECLNASDEDSNVYGYIGEAEAFTSWLEHHTDKVSLEAAEDYAVSVFEEMIDHRYSPETFETAVQLALQRVALFHLQGLI